MRNEIEFLKEKLPLMRVKNSVQIGFFNIAVTNILKDFGDVYLYTQAKFNPFEDETSVHMDTEIPPNHASLTFKKKFGDVDILYLGGLTHYLDVRLALCAWVPNVRLNGIIIIPGIDKEEIKAAIHDYVGQIDAEAFDVNYDEEGGFASVIPTK